MRGCELDGRDQLADAGLRVVAPDEDGAPVTHLEFSSNDLLKDICGPHDQHLALVEQMLDICIIPRGNLLVMRGDGAARAVALAALRYLLDSHRHGVPITPGDVTAALRQGQGDRGGAGREQRHIGGRQAAMTGKLTGDMAGTAQDGDTGPGKEHVLTLPKRTIAPRGNAQRGYIEALQRSELVFGVGPAGTGKTYLAVAYAAHLFLAGEVERIILSRPAVEAGERIGFLPGDMKDKVDPYLRPLYDALYDVLHTDFVDRRIASGEIEIAPLAFMRGRTLSRAAIILDEAQNATTGQMKMFLTRLGEGSRMVITGDPSQTDLPPQESSGLQDALSLLDGVADMRVARFSAHDIVRHPLVAKIVAAYEARDRKIRRDVS